VNPEWNKKNLLRRRVGVAIVTPAALALILTLALLSVGPTMPSYAGRSAEAWLNIYHDRSGYTSAVEAFRQMGTNGIAFLVESLGRGDNVWSRRLYPWIFRHVPIVVAKRLPEPMYRDALASTAQMVLDVLSLEKRDPEPERTFARLVKFLELHDDFRREGVAAEVARYAEMYPRLDLTPFRPELVRALNDDYLGVRLFIADSSRIAKLLGPDHVRWSLTPYLTNSDPSLRVSAREVLFRAGFTNVVGAQINVP